MDTQLKDNKMKIATLEAEIISIKKEKDGYKKEFKAAKGELKTVVIDIEKKRKEDDFWPRVDENKWADIASVQVENKLSTVSYELGVMKDATSEANDKENRRNNLNSL